AGDRRRPARAGRGGEVRLRHRVPARPDRGRDRDPDGEAAMTGRVGLRAHGRPPVTGPDGPPPDGPGPGGPGPETVPAPVRRPLRVLLVAEGSYPFHPGGVSLWCDQIIRGMPEHAFTVVALTVDGTEFVVWPAPGNPAARAGPRPPRRSPRRTSTSSGPWRTRRGRTPPPPAGPPRPSCPPCAPSTTTHGPATSAPRSPPTRRWTG